MWRNPVMLIVEAGAVLVSIAFVIEPSAFTIGIAVWLWLTVLFANLAESVAEGRGKAQAESLRKTRTATSALLVQGYDGQADAGAERADTVTVSSADLRRWRRRSWSSPARRSPATATSCGASRRSTSPRSRASPRP